MYSRQVEGETLVFGNQGALFLNALTMFDHETESVWGQVWGKALFGPRAGQTLELLPATLAPWSTWRATHPHALAMSTGVGGFRLFREGARDDFVIGVALGDVARAYRWRDASRVGVVNDLVGDVPVVVAGNPMSRNIAVFGRIVGDRLLTFRLDLDREELVDDETGSRWNTSTGVAVSGPLRSSVLKNIPWSPAFDWAWMNHYPHSTFYRAG